MKVAIISNGNAFSTMMLRPVLEEQGIEVTRALLVRVPSGGGNAASRLAGLVRHTGLHYATYKALTLVVPALAKLTGAKPFLDDQCRAHGIQVRSVRSANAPESLAFLRAGEPEVLISVSCPEKFDPEVLEVPSVAAINIHWARLPAYAGVAPYFWVLRNGEPDTALTVHVMAPTLDAGPVLGRQEVDIGPDDTVLSLQMRLAQAGATSLIEAVRGLPDSLATAEPQDLTGRSYFTWPTPKDTRALHARGRKLLRLADLKGLWRAVRGPMMSRGPAHE